MTLKRARREAEGRTLVWREMILAKARAMGTGKRWTVGI